MPTILRINGYRFFFFSNEHEPIHVHIEKGDKYAKSDVVSLKIEDSYKLTSKELSLIHI